MKHLCFEGSQTTYACLPDKSTKMKIDVVRWWRDTDRRKTEVLGKKPIPMPICAPQISYELVWDRTRVFAVTVRRLTVSPMARSCHAEDLFSNTQSSDPESQKTHCRSTIAA